MNINGKNSIEDTKSPNFINKLYHYIFYLELVDGGGVCLAGGVGACRCTPDELEPFADVEFGGGNTEDWFWLGSITVAVTPGGSTDNAEGDGLDLKYCNINIILYIIYYNSYMICRILIICILHTFTLCVVY